MPTLRPSLLLSATATFALLALCACTPKFNWRDVQQEIGLYAVAMPAKPSTFTRQIDLNGVQTSMTMTAAEVGDVTFAVGTAEMPDATQAQVTLTAMKGAMVRNINGTIKQEKVLTMPLSTTEDLGRLAVTEIAAEGSAGTPSAGQPRLLFARFFAKERRVYQLVVIGPQRGLKRDDVDTFFSSFRFN